MIVGLGNPGEAHDGTPHNLGFAAVDEVVRRHGLGPWVDDGAVVACGWPMALESLGPVLMVKPWLGMNDSGRALRPLLAERVRSLDDVLVVVDDISLAPGHLRIDERAGTRGHNGLRDLEAHLGRGFQLLRLGVGPPPGELGPFVVGRFARHHEPVMRAMVDRAGDCLELWRAWGIGVAARLAGAPA